MTGKTGRRGHNEGSIYQRASDGGGLVPSISAGNHRSQAQGRLWQDPRRGVPEDRQAPRPPSEGSADPDLGGDVAEFLDDGSTIPCSLRATRTYDSYQSMVERHLKPHSDPEGGRPSNTIMEMMRARREGASERSIGYIRAVLRIALNEAMRLDLVHRNVAALVKPPTSSSTTRGVRHREALQFLELSRTIAWKRSTAWRSLLDCVSRRRSACGGTTSI